MINIEKLKKNELFKDIASVDKLKINRIRNLSAILST